MTCPLRIIITAYNSAAFLPDCLAALCAQSFSDFEVVIVDNGGTPDGAHKIDLPDDRFSHILSPVNDGFSGGFVRGAEGAATDWLMSLNPDTVLDPDCLSHLMRSAETMGRPAMVSPVLYQDAGQAVLDGAGDSLSIWGIAWRNGYGHSPEVLPDRAFSEVFSPTGAAALYRREAYEKAGGFDADFFCYIEDVDLAVRIRAMGGRCLLVHAATGRHVGGHSTQDLPGFAMTHTVRNSPLMIGGSLPVPLQWVVWTFYRLGQYILQRRALRSGSPRDRAIAQFRRDGFALARDRRHLIDKKRKSRPRYPFMASMRLARRLHWGVSGFRHHRLLAWPWR